MKLVFICTGNTCRSPMAEGIYNVEAARWGLPPARSAGLFAEAGDAVSCHAVTAAGEYGADISGHRAQPVTAALLAECDKVLCMTYSHMATLQARFPQYREKYRLLASLGILDPYGKDLEAYRNCAAVIYGAVQKFLRESAYDGDSGTV